MPLIVILSTSLRQKLKISLADNLGFSSCSYDWEVAGLQKYAGQFSCNYHWMNGVEPSDAFRIMKVEIRLIHNHCLIHIHNHAVTKRENIFILSRKFLSRLVERIKMLCRKAYKYNFRNFDKWGQWLFELCSTEPLYGEFRNFECPSKIFRKKFYPCGMEERLHVQLTKVDLFFK